MPVFFFGDTRGKAGQRPLTTWLFCLGLFLTREHVHIVQWNVGDNWVSLPCSKRQLSWPLQTKCVGLLWSMSHYTLLLLQLSVLLFMWFWCHCKNSLHLAIPQWELFPCTRYLENKVEQERPPTMQCKPNWMLKAWRRNEEWVLSGIQALAAPSRAFELMLSCVSFIFITVT